jgi:protocatechuate 3,4-dioxygenase beta subunit
MKLLGHVWDDRWGKVERGSVVDALTLLTGDFDEISPTRCVLKMRLLDTEGNEIPDAYLEIETAE